MGLNKNILKMHPKGMPTFKKYFKIESLNFDHKCQSCWLFESKKSLLIVAIQLNSVFERVSKFAFWLK